MKKDKTAALFVLGLLCVCSPASSLYAQRASNDSTLTRTVIVENEYNPDILDASKINVLPKVEEPAVTKKDIEYSNVLMPANSFGPYQELLPFTAKEVQQNANRGYLRLGYGNRGNVDAKLSYLWDISSKDRLGIAVSLDGRNGKVSQVAPFYDPNSEPLGEWKSRYYRTNVSANYLHRFSKMDMRIAGKFESDVFNYEDHLIIDNWGNAVNNSRQHHTKGEGHLGFSSTDEDLPIHFKAETNYLYFDKKYGLEDSEANEEHIIRTCADVFGAITDDSHIGVKAELTNLFYSMSGLSNYTVLDLTPYYRLEGDVWKLKLGAHVDFSFSKGKSIQVAPDVEAQYVMADNHVLYIRAKGGRQLNDYRRLELESPYWIPNFVTADHVQLKNTYVPLDASLGFKSTPFSGFSFRLFGGYKIKNDDLCFYNTPVYSHFQIADTKAFYLGGALTWQYKDIANLSFNGTYHNWDADNDKLLVMKPELELDAELSLKILSNLYLNIGYEYVSRPSVTLTAYDFSGIKYDYQMSAINNLSVGATYKLFKNLSVYARLNNLLNKDYQYYYGYSAQKFNFVAGASLSF